MENRIKSYEEYINKQLKKPNKDLLNYHQQMVQNFQHERLVHLLITFFFITLTIAVLAVTVILTYSILPCYWWYLTPAFILTLLLVVMSVCYVKHYYFLENRIQKLYDITRKLAEK